MPRKKRGPGHPVTTGMASVPPIHYRVTSDQHAELTAEARKLPKVRGETPSASAAAKLRAFPGVTRGRGKRKNRAKARPLADVPLPGRP